MGGVKGTGRTDAYLLTARRGMPTPTAAAATAAAAAAVQTLRLSPKCGVFSTFAGQVDPNTGRAMEVIVLQPGTYTK